MRKKLSTRAVWARGVIAAVLAAALNLAVALISATMVGASPDFRPLQPGPVFSVTIVIVLAGTAVFAVLNRVTARPVPVFTVVASVVALVSLIAPIVLASDTSGTLTGVTPAAAYALIPLHLIAAAVLIIALPWRRPGQPDPSRLGAEADGQTELSESRTVVDDSSMKAPDSQS